MCKAGADSGAEERAEWKMWKMSAPNIASVYSTGPLARVVPSAFLYLSVCIRMRKLLCSFSRVRSLPRVLHGYDRMMEKSLDLT